MRKVFQNDETEGLLLVDAENAFNNLNRKAALHNIHELCPPFYRFLHNTYQTPSKMIINDQEKVDSVLSEEGSTQGDVSAMAMYAIGIRPLLNILHGQTDSSKSPPPSGPPGLPEDAEDRGVIRKVLHPLMQ